MLAVHDLRYEYVCYLMRHATNVVTDVLELISLPLATQANTTQYFLDLHVTVIMQYVWET